MEPSAACRGAVGLCQQTVALAPALRAWLLTSGRSDVACDEPSEPTPTRFSVSPPLLGAAVREQGGPSSPARSLACRRSGTSLKRKNLQPQLLEHRADFNRGYVRLSGPGRSPTLTMASSPSPPATVAPCAPSLSPGDTGTWDMLLFPSRASVPLLGQLPFSLASAPAPCLILFSSSEPSISSADPAGAWLKTRRDPARRCEGRTSTL